MCVCVWGGGGGGGEGGDGKDILMSWGYDVLVPTVSTAIYTSLSSVIMTTKLIEPNVRDPALEHAHLTDDLYL